MPEVVASSIGRPAPGTVARIVQDVGIRIAGALLLAMAAAALFALGRIVKGGGDPNSGATYVLAAVGFVGATFGSGLIALGAHVLDRVHVSQRWSPRR